jgi:hypothetical protein
MRLWEEKNLMHSSSAVVLFSRLCRILPSAVLHDFFLSLPLIGVRPPVPIPVQGTSCPWMKILFAHMQRKAPQIHSSFQRSLQEMSRQGRDQFQTRELDCDDHSFEGKKLKVLYLITNKVSLNDFDFQMMSSSLALSRM